MKTSRRHTAAFTLVELMIALTIALIVTAGIYSLYTNYVKAFIAQDRVIETQQAARVAIDTLTQDLIRAGYKVPTSSPAVVYAGETRIDVQMWDDSAGQMRQVRYFVSGGQLMREVYRNTGISLVLVSTVSGPLVDNVEASPSGDPAIRFRYYNQTEIQSDPLAPDEIPVSTAIDATVGTPTQATIDALNAIRRIHVTLTVRSADRDPVRKAYVYRTLSADVKPRNMGLLAALQDQNPPAVPQKLFSADPNACGFLNVSWQANTEPDLAGYTVYWRDTTVDLPGNYPYSVAVSKGATSTMTYQLSGLFDGRQYALAISAFDYSGNSSGMSPEVTTGTSVSGMGVADATPNVGNPKGAVTGFEASTPAERQVLLKWTPLAEPDIQGGGNGGYRIFRKFGDFQTADLDSIRNGSYASRDIRLIASESYNYPYDGSKLTFADTTADLKGCVETYYAIVPIKGCSFATDGYTNDLIATVGPVRPTDTTKPDPAGLTAFPSYLRNYLTITNPTNPDFEKTYVAYRTDSVFPTFLVDNGTIQVSAGSRLVECAPAGGFTGTTSISYTHTGLPCNPPGFYLEKDQTYRYTAVALDSCMNLSDYTNESSKVLATQCDDDLPAGPSDPNPPGYWNPPTLKVTGGGTNIWGTTERIVSSTKSRAEISWNGIDSSPDKIRDLAGYYVYQVSGDAASTTPTVALDHRDLSIGSGPITTTKVTLSDLDEGKVVRLRVLGVDCETVTKGDSVFNVRYPDHARFDEYASNTLIFYPGTVLLDGAVAPRTAAKDQNQVVFQLKNTINADATSGSGEKVELKQLRFDWTSLNGTAGADRRLRSVTINYTGLATPWKINVGDVVSGTVIPAAGTGIKAGTNATVTLEFMSSVTGSTRKADMRALQIQGSLTYVPVTRLDSDLNPAFTVGTQEATVDFTVPAVSTPAITNVVIRRYNASPADTFASAQTSPGLVYGAATMEVSADVSPTSGAITRVQVLYAMTDRLATATPPDPGTTLPASASLDYTPVVVCSSSGTPCAIGPQTYRTTIPAQPNKRIWFFVMVEDSQGNFSTSPQSYSGETVMYAYDQTLPPTIANVQQRLNVSTATYVDGKTTIASYSYSGGAAIQVKADVTDNSGRGTGRVRVLYKVDSKTVTTPPDPGVLPGVSGYSTLNVCDSDPTSSTPDCSTSPAATYTAVIPGASNARVWYFVLVEDKAGSWSAAPSQSPATTMYTYDHGGLI